MVSFGWIFSIITSLFISLCCPCCFLQLFFNLLGIGCAGLSNFLVPYRPLFISLTVISLTYSYIRYRPSKRRFMFMIMLTLFLSFSSEILQRNDNHSKYDNNEVENNIIITHWQIQGMHCESCRLAATRSLQNLKGIVHVNVDLDTGQADLFTDIPIDDSIVIDAIQSAGFQIYKII